jgi:predicted nucleotidyltransferase component of viral defense system
MKIVKDLKLPFYLSGGTALSRYYFHHRYSDDLDFFVNKDSGFKQHVSLFINYCREHKNNTGFEIVTERIHTSEDYFQLFIKQQDVELKLDFINDIPLRFGEINNSYDFPIDSIRNILSNKISALYRLEVKDFVDIWMIAKNTVFNWKEVIYEAKEKESSIDAIEIFNLFKSFPFNRLNLIKWIIPVQLEDIRKDFEVIAEDIFEGHDNKLFK